MSMPEFPPQHHRPNLYQTTIDLLDSIALEEIALSHLLNAEGEKIQQFICNTSSCTPPDVLIDFNIVVNETLETVIMKEWLLIRKLEKVVRFFTKQFSSHCHCCSTCQPNHCHANCNHEPNHCHDNSNCEPNHCCTNDNCCEPSCKMHDNKRNY